MQLGQKNSLIQRVAWMLVDISMLPFFILRRENRMPKTKKQGIIFGLIMSYAMAYGMEVYNTAIKDGFSLRLGGFSTMTNHVFYKHYWKPFIWASLSLSFPIYGEIALVPTLPKKFWIHKRIILIFVD